jgi:hypothetical protein
MPTERSDMPDNWYQTVEKAKNKARKLLQKTIAVDQNTSVVVGKLVGVDIDTLWRAKYPYCKLTIEKPVRYRTDGNFECHMGDTELFFVNKPEMIMTTVELNDRFPKVHADAATRLKTGEFE